MKTIVSAILIWFVSFSAMADCPNFNKAFQPQALDDLNVARALPGAKPFENESEYAVEIVYSSALQKYVVLFGEKHLKTLLAKRIGLNVIRHFGLRAFETIPEYEDNSLTWGSHWSMALGGRIVKASGRKEKSTIDDVTDVGRTLSPEGYVMWNGKADYTRYYSHMIKRFCLSLPVVATLLD
jgi:hypothetical protein